MVQLLFYHTYSTLAHPCYKGALGWRIIVGLPDQRYGSASNPECDTIRGLSSGGDQKFSPLLQKQHFQIPENNFSLPLTHHSHLLSYIILFKKKIAKEHELKNKCVIQSIITRTVVRRT